MGKPSVSISIVTWNSEKEICDCLQSLERLPANWKVFVVDNNSSDNTTKLIRERFPFVTLITNSVNEGFAKANNQVINQTDTDYVLVLNPDTRPEPAGLEKCLVICDEHPEIGLLGVRLCNEDHSLQISCLAYPTLWKNLVEALSLHRFYPPERRAELFAGGFFDHARAREVDWVAGAFMLVRRKAIEKSGPIPEDYFMFAEDLDWCWQIARNGYKIWFTPAVSILHKGNKSAGQFPSDWRIERTTLSKYLFCFKNLGWLPTRIIQLSDFLGMNYNILRVGNKPSRVNEVREWKAARWYVLKSLVLSRKQIQALLNNR